HGLAHITGGGIRDNLRRIMPEGLSAKIDLNSIKILPVFNCIRNCGDVPDQDMLRTFNLGVGMIMVAPEDEAGLICDALQELQCHTYQIGKIVDGKRDVVFDGKLNWKE
ncbi:MAG: hypothetical protein KDD42_03805, partial [Bdellovibrionales bacterium]|nr:hypothetical protein [Bdellovibrionales bacterium]